MYLHEHRSSSWCHSTGYIPGLEVRLLTPVVFIRARPDSFSLIYVPSAFFVSFSPSDVVGRERARARGRAHSRGRLCLERRELFCNVTTRVMNGLLALCRSSVCVWKRTRDRSTSKHQLRCPESTIHATAERRPLEKCRRRDHRTTGPCCCCRCCS